MLVNAKRLEKFVEAINRERPMCCLWLDLVDRSISHVQNSEWGDPRKLNNARIYAIAGNHEFYGRGRHLCLMEDQCHRAPGFFGRDPRDCLFAGPGRPVCS